MNRLALIKSANFDRIQCDIYSNKDEIYMTISQLAKALGYASNSGIENIISRHSYLTQPEFSVTDRLSATDGKTYTTRLFTEDGIYEITFLSKTPKAREFRAWVRKILKALRIRDKPQPTTTPLSYYQGNPVMLLKEIAVVLNKSVWTVRQHIHKLKENVDYLVLSGRSLMEFKVENSHISERIHSALTIVLESGIRKLASALGLDAPVLDSRLTLLPVAKPRATTGSSKPYRKSSVAELIRIYQEEFGKKPEPKVVAFLLLFEEYEEFGFKQGFNECRQLYEPGAPALR